MKHLLGCWDELRPAIENQYLIICLDYDGTLTPICDKPWQAKLSSPTKVLLSELASFNDVKMAIVSGRSLADIKKFVGVPGLIYVGNHGLEIEGPQIMHVHPDAAVKEELFREISDKLKKSLRIKGVIVENKKLSVAVHYRLIAKDHVSQAKNTFLRVAQPFLDQNELVIGEGKKVWEVRSALLWNKGTAVSWLTARFFAHCGESILPIYIGDDYTDEDALERIKKNGIGVKVMSHLNEQTSANYFLLSPSEVLAFLKQVKEWKQLKRSEEK